MSLFCPTIVQEDNDFINRCKRLVCASCSTQMETRSHTFILLLHIFFIFLIYIFINIINIYITASSRRTIQRALCYTPNFPIQNHRFERPRPISFTGMSNLWSSSKIRLKFRYIRYTKEIYP